MKLSTVFFFTLLASGGQATAVDELSELDGPGIAIREPEADGDLSHLLTIARRCKTCNNASCCAVRTNRCCGTSCFNNRKRRCCFYRRYYFCGARGHCCGRGCCFRGNHCCKVVGVERYFCRSNGRSCGRNAIDVMDQSEKSSAFAEATLKS